MVAVLVYASSPQIILALFLFKSNLYSGYETSEFMPCLAAGRHILTYIEGIMVSTCRISVSVALEAPVTARRHLLCITAYFFYCPISSHLCSLLKSTRQTMLKWWPDVFNIFTPETPFNDWFTTSRQASTQFVAKRKRSVMISSFLSLFW